MTNDQISSSSISYKDRAICRPCFFRWLRPIAGVFSKYLKKIFIFFIHLYKLCISPYLGNHCRFYPSCSEYAQTAIVLHGPTKGGWLTLKRLCRCHPFCRGGVDLVPPKHSSSVPPFSKT